MIPEVYDLSAPIHTVIMSLSAIVAVCIGGYVVYMLIKLGLIWLTCNTLDKHKGSCSMCREFKK